MKHGKEKYTNSIDKFLFMYFMQYVYIIYASVWHVCMHVYGCVGPGASN